MSNYIPSSHSRSGSLAPPTDSELAPIDLNVRHNSLYRRHSRKKSSHILVEPIGGEGNHANYMPITPTYAIPPGLQTIYDGDAASPSSPTSGSAGAASASGSLSRHGSMRNRSHQNTSLESNSVPRLRSPSATSAASGTASSAGVELDSDTSSKSGREIPRKNVSVTANTLASGASFLIAGQFFAKLLTFSLNQLVLRFVGPQTFGANAQLELIITTCLYFSREAIRLAAQRESLTGKLSDVYRFEGGAVAGTQSGTVQQVINIGFVPLLVGIPLSTILSYLYIHFAGSADFDPRTIKVAVMIFAISSILELLSEPSFLYYQFQLQFKKRASFESIAIFARCAISVLFVFMGRKGGSNNAIIAFALGQFAYSSVLAILYIFSSVQDTRLKPYQITFPRSIWKNDNSNEKIYFSRETTKLAGSIWLQTVFKHCLTEGDKFLISLILPMTDQGVYAVVVNYGSLIARLVFLPIEEALRNFFSKLLAGSVTRENRYVSIIVITGLLRVYSYLSIFAVTFGPLVSHYVLQFLVSSQWLDSDADKVLATYACYIPFLAINGALESFVQSVASPSDIRRQSSALLVFSITFASSAYFLMKPLGMAAQGLILANMFNMAQRIVWCILYIENYYAVMREPDSQNELDGKYAWILRALPKPTAIAAVVATVPCVAYVGKVTEFKQLVKLLGLAGVLGAVILYAERDLVLQLLGKYKNKVEEPVVAPKKEVNKESEVVENENPSKLSETNETSETKETNSIKERKKEN